MQKNGLKGVLGPFRSHRIMKTEMTTCVDGVFSQAKKLDQKSIFYEEANMAIAKGFSEPTDRIKKLKARIIDAMPTVEADRAELLTEAYKK